MKPRRSPCEDWPGDTRRPQVERSGHCTPRRPPYEEWPSDTHRPQVERSANDTTALPGRRGQSTPTALPERRGQSTPTDLKWRGWPMTPPPSPGGAARVHPPPSTGGSADDLSCGNDDVAHATTTGFQYFLTSGGQGAKPTPSLTQAPFSTVRGDRVRRPLGTTLRSHA